MLCVQEYSLLYEEATFFQLAPLKAELERWKAEQERREVSRDCECAVVHVTPELGERISVSAARAVMEEVFPEVTDIICSTMNTSWNQDPTHVLRFPLNGYCHLTSVQVQNTLCLPPALPRITLQCFLGHVFCQHVFGLRLKR